MPDVQVSRQPSRFINVDLPDPDGPMMATDVAPLHFQRNIAQGVDDFRAHLIVPGDVLEANEAHRFSPVK